VFKTIRKGITGWAGISANFCDVLAVRTATIRELNFVLVSFLCRIEHVSVSRTFEACGALQKKNIIYVTQWSKLVYSNLLQGLMTYFKNVFLNDTVYWKTYQITAPMHN